MSKTMKLIFKIILFLLIFIIIFNFFQTLFMDKHSYIRYRNWKVQENSDILIMGNSHAEYAVDAVDFEQYLLRETGADVSVFNYGVYGMRMEQLYFFYKDIIKIHKPDLIILDTFVFCPIADKDREILAHRAFDPLPLSLNKIQGINYCVIEDRWSHYIPMGKYHSRWKELLPYDYSYMFNEEEWEDSGRKLVPITHSEPDPGDGWFEQEVPGIDDVLEPNATQKECFEKFLALLEKDGIDLFLVSFPFKEQQDKDSLDTVRTNNYLLKNYVNGTSVKLLDMNRMWKELDIGYYDLCDPGHLNLPGAKKICDYLFPYLKDNYDILSYVG